MHARAVGEKIELINESYERARQNIVDNCRRVCDEINDSVQNLINLIMVKKYLMLKDVEARQNEMLIDFKVKARI